jgi:hypothetical protein
MGDAERTQTLKTIEGGSTTDEVVSPITIKGPFDVEKHRGVLTFMLIILLAVVIIGHYLCVLLMEWNGKKIDGVTNAFNTALPVISGLVGSAIAYYFTRRDGSSRLAK